MKPAKIVALAALALGAAYVLGLNPFGIFSALDETLTPLEQTLRNAAARLTGQSQQFAAGAPQRSGAGGYSLTAGAASSAAGIAAGAGAAVATVALVAGIAGGVAILVWGIVKRGWFRGGEEALHVNPARDELMDVTATIPFADKPYGDLKVWPTVRAKNMDGREVADFGSIPRSDWSQVRYESMLKLFGAAGVDGNTANSVITQLYQADTMKEFEPAAYRYVEALQAGARAQGVAV